MGRSATMARWWAVVVIGAAVALLFAWLGRLAGVAPAVLLSIGAAVAALTWVVVLMTVPWNLYFGARQVVAEMTVSRSRGITVHPDRTAEAERIARRMLRFAIAAHVGTAAVTAAAAAVTGALVGYYVAGFFLVSTLVRPAAAYFAHLRGRISALGTETAHPRDDVVTLKADVSGLTVSLKELRAEVQEARRTDLDDSRRVTTGLAADLTRLADAQASDRATARAGVDDLRRTLEHMTRHIDATLDGVSDHQELLVGIRALVRLIRAGNTT